MRVLHVTPARGPGGGPEHVRLLVTLHGAGVEPAVVCPPGAWLAEQIGGAAEVTALDLSRPNPLRTRALRRLLRRVQPDVVHAHGRGAGLHVRLASRGLSSRLVYTLHGLHVSDPPSLRDRIYLRGEAWLASSVGRFIAVSPGERQKMLAAGFASAARIVLVWNGIDPAYVTGPPAAPPEEGEPLRLLTVARPSRQKGLDRIPGVLRDLDRLGVDVTWTVAGASPAHATCSDPRVRWAGPVTMDPGRYRALHVLVSLARWEGLPLSVLEAAAVGLPVVATDVVGNRDALERLGAGERCVPLAAMAAQVSALAAPGAWREASSALREAAAAKADARAMVNATEAVYRSLVAADAP